MKIRNIAIARFDCWTQLEIPQLRDGLNALVVPSAAHAEGLFKALRTVLDATAPWPDDAQESDADSWSVEVVLEHDRAVGEAAARGTLRRFRSIRGLEVSPVEESFRSDAATTERAAGDRPCTAARTNGGSHSAAERNFPIDSLWSPNPFAPIDELAWGRGPYAALFAPARNGATRRELSVCRQRLDARLEKMRADLKALERRERRLARRIQRRARWLEHAARRQWEWENAQRRLAAARERVSVLRQRRRTLLEQALVERTARRLDVVQRQIDELSAELGESAAASLADFLLVSDVEWAIEHTCRHIELCRHTAFRRLGESQERLRTLESDLDELQRVIAEAPAQAIQPTACSNDTGASVAGAAADGSTPAAGLPRPRSAADARQLLARLRPAARRLRNARRIYDQHRKEASSHSNAHAAQPDEHQDGVASEWEGTGDIRAHSTASASSPAGRAGLRESEPHLVGLDTALIFTARSDGVEQAVADLPRVDADCKARASKLRSAQLEKLAALEKRIEAIRIRISQAESPRGEDPGGGHASLFRFATSIGCIVGGLALTGAALWLGDGLWQWALISTGLTTTFAAALLQLGSDPVPHSVRMRQAYVANMRRVLLQKTRRRQLLNDALAANEAAHEGPLTKLVNEQHRDEPRPMPAETHLVLDGPDKAEGEAVAAAEANRLPRDVRFVTHGEQATARRIGRPQAARELVAARRLWRAALAQEGIDPSLSPRRVYHAVRQALLDLGPDEGGGHSADSELVMPPDRESLAANEWNRRAEEILTRLGWTGTSGTEGEGLREAPRLRQLQECHQSLASQVAILKSTLDRQRDECDAWSELAEAYCLDGTRHGSSVRADMIRPDTPMKHAAAETIEWVAVDAATPLEDVVDQPELSAEHVEELRSKLHTWRSLQAETLRRTGVANLAELRRRICQQDVYEHLLATHRQLADRLRSQRQRCNPDGEIRRLDALAHEGPKPRINPQLRSDLRATRRELRDTVSAIARLEEALNERGRPSNAKGDREVDDEQSPLDPPRDASEPSLESCDVKRGSGCLEVGRGRQMMRIAARQRRDQARREAVRVQRQRLGKAFQACLAALRAIEALAAKHAAADGFAELHDSEIVSRIIRRMTRGRIERVALDAKGGRIYTAIRGGRSLPLAQIPQRWASRVWLACRLAAMHTAAEPWRGLPAVWLVPDAEARRLTRTIGRTLEEYSQQTGQQLIVICSSPAAADRLASAGVWVGRIERAPESAGMPDTQPSYMSPRDDGQLTRRAEAIADAGTDVSNNFASANPSADLPTATRMFEHNGPSGNETVVPSGARPVSFPEDVQPQGRWVDLRRWSDPEADEGRAEPGSPYQVIGPLVVPGGPAGRVPSARAPRESETHGPVSVQTTSAAIHPVLRRILEALVATESSANATWPPTGTEPTAPSDQSVRVYERETKLRRHDAADERVGRVADWPVAWDTGAATVDPSLVFAELTVEGQGPCDAAGILPIDVAAVSGSAAGVSAEVESSEQESSESPPAEEQRPPSKRAKSPSPRRRSPRRAKRRGPPEPDWWPD